MKSLKEVISYLHDTFDLQAEPQSEGVAATRLAAVESIAEYLENRGFPSTEDDKMSLSLVPYIFQEANYDDIDWSSKDSDLGHLEAFFELDLLVQFAGRERSDITAGGYVQYHALSLKAIQKK